MKNSTFEARDFGGGKIGAAPFAEQRTCCYREQGRLCYSLNIGVTSHDSRVPGKMGNELKILIERARKIKMTESERSAQRRSFVFGNTHFENELITREMVDEIADHLEAAKPAHD
jgi:hypothetical protein